MLRDNIDSYKARAEAVRTAEIYRDYFAIARCPSEGLESPTVVGAQAANELLNIAGVKASFVLTSYNNEVYILSLIHILWQSRKECVTEHEHKRGKRRDQTYLTGLQPEGCSRTLHISQTPAASHPAYGASRNRENSDHGAGGRGM